MPNAVVVFPKDGVTNPMEAVLDMPMITPPVEQLSRVGLVTGDAGDGIGRFDCLFAVAKNATRESADLFLSGPIETPRQTRGGLQTVAGESPMPFRRCFGDLAEGFMLKLRVGGKIPPGTRRRWCSSVRADCL